MSRSRKIATSVLSVGVVVYFGLRLHEWLATGRLWTSGRYNPGRYLSFADAPVGLLISVGFDVIIIVIAVVLLLDAIAAD